jgi:hypothetical protein
MIADFIDRSRHALLALFRIVVDICPHGFGECLSLASLLDLGR